MGVVKSSMTLLLLILVTLSQASVADPPDPDNMLARATKLANTSDWAYPYYVWRDKETLIFFQGEKIKTDPNVSAELSLDTLKTLHLKTKQVSVLSVFQSHWKKLESPVGPVHQILWLTLSPDSKWLVMETKWQSDGPPEGISVVNLRSGEWQDYASPLREGSIAWTRDSRHWITMGWTPPAVLTAEVHDPAIPSRERRILLPMPVKNSPDQKHLIYIPLGQREDGLILVKVLHGNEQYENAPSQATMVFLEFALSAPSIRPHLFTLTLPVMGRVNSIVLSPRGDRLIWHLFIREKVDALHWLDEFWISKLDGSQARKLGSIDATIGSDPLKPLQDYILALQWTPDGKQVSFVYRDTLWLLPAK